MIGASIPAAEDALRSLVEGLTSVDTVEGSSPRGDLPRTAANVYLRGARDITARLTRGIVTQETYLLDVLVEVHAKPGTPLGTREGVRGRMWQILRALDQALGTDPRLGGTVTEARLQVEDLDTGWANPAWLARAYAAVACLATARP